MDYREAERVFNSARNKDAGKPLESNTRLHAHWLVENHPKPVYAVRLHATDVVTLHPDNTFTLNSGGWRTPTTKERINTYSPAGVFQKGGLWYIGHWSHRASVLFEDGMTIDDAGLPIGATTDPAPLEKAKRKVDRMVRDYIKGFVNDIKENGLEDPGNGDCLCCLKGDPLGLDHYLSHFEEGYFVPRLLWLAMQKRGNPSFVWAITKDNPEWAADDLRAYFRSRKLGLSQLLLERGLNHPMFRKETQ